MLRHECKHEISYLDFLTIRQRMRAIAQTDTHSIDGKYQIRSLYFDTPQDKALREKIDGVSNREKFRIRCYNGDHSLIRLEKKSKYAGLCGKASALLSPDEVQKICAGDLDFMPAREDKLINELYAKMTVQHLRPKTIVDYTREAFCFAPGNTRVTLDYDIRTSLACTDFLNPYGMTIPTPDAPIILEVKWDEFLPQIIFDAIQLDSVRTGAFSKYAAARAYI